MSWSFVATRGTNREQTSDQTLGVNPTATIAAGSVLIVVIQADNIAASTGDTTSHSVTDTQGNTYTRVKEYTFSDAGVALDGVTSSIFYSILTTQLTTGDTVTLTVSANVTSKIISLAEFTIAGGSTLSVPTTVGVSRNELASGGTDLDAVFSGLSSSEYLIVSSAALETAAVSTWANDSDYTTLYDQASAASGFTIWGSSQYRIATLTGDTCSAVWTWASGTRDSAHALGVVLETAGGNTISGGARQHHGGRGR